MSQDSDGTTQPERLSPLLLGDAPQVDSLPWQARLAASARIAKLFTYYDFNNRRDGSLAPFFESDVQVALAQIATYRLEGMLRSVRSQYTRPQMDSVEGLCLSAPLLMSALARVDIWWRKLPDAMPVSFRHTMEQTIQGPLSRVLSMLVAAQPDLQNKAARLEPTVWRLGESDRQSLTLALLLVEQSFAYMSAQAAQALGTYTSDGRQAPQTALFQAFVKLLEYPRGRVNRFTERQLGFYYGKILRQTPRPPVPDRAIVFFVPAPKKPATFLPAGTRLAAGKDALKQERTYRLLTDTLVDTATIGRVAVLYVRGADKATGQQDVFFAMFEPTPPSPKARSSSPGTGLDPLAPGFPTFGAAPGSGVLYADRMKPADVGFALSSPLLLLESGERTIKLELTVSSSIDSPPAFRVRLSGSDGWIDCPNLVKLQNDRLVFTIKLSASRPAVAPFDSKKLGSDFPDGPPVLVALLDQEATSLSGSGLMKVKVTDVRLVVKVEGMRSFSLASSSGPLTTGKPFAPFGQSPLKGAEFLIGSTEMFQKPLTSLSLKLKWANLPKPVGTPVYSDWFTNYYNGYKLAVGGVRASELYSTESFKVAFDYRRDGAWTPLDVGKRICGVDVSQHHSPGTWHNLVNVHNVKFAVVRCWQNVSPGIPDSNCPESVAHAWQAGVALVDLYFFPIVRNTPMARQVSECLDFLHKKHDVSYRRIWLDVEGHTDKNTWYPEVHRNVERIQEWVDSMQKKNVDVGIYCSTEGWKEITGQTDQFKTLPLWWCSHGNDFAPFGGWEMPSMVQQGKIGNIDSDYIDGPIHISTPSAKNGPQSECLLFCGRSNGALDGTTSWQLTSYGKSLNRPVLDPSHPSSLEPLPDSGVLRIRLTEPSYGFGQSLYPKAAVALALKHGENLIQLAKNEVISSSGKDSSGKDSGGKDSGGNGGKTNRRKGSEKPLPSALNLPYTPRLASLSIDYTATGGCKSSDDEPSLVYSMYHISPLGITRCEDEKQPTLLPELSPGGTLYLGIRGVDMPNPVSCLFLLQNSAQTVRDASNIVWRCLIQTGWQELTTDPTASPGNGWVADRTDGFSHSGIIEFQFPEGTAPLNAQSPDLRWVSAYVAEDLEDYPATRAVQTQAVWCERVLNTDADTNYDIPLPAGSITRLMKAVPAIAEIQQPLPSTGGRRGEDIAGLYTRVSERCRHKERAVTSWDYERLVLQAAPWVFAARCMAPVSMTAVYEPSAMRATGRANGASPALQRAPGTVRMVIFPRVYEPDSLTRASYPPYIAPSRLAKLRAMLATRAPAAAKIAVLNPEYVIVTVSCTVTAAPRHDPMAVAKELDNDLRIFLSPWIFSPDEARDLAFPEYSDIWQFIHTRTYVATLSEFSLTLKPENAPGRIQISAFQHEIQARTFGS